jgi:hypothetical protein
MSQARQTTTSPATARTAVDAVIILIAVTALVGITVFTVREYDADPTKAATILGIVVPAFATIGAAAFGITVAYNAGQQQGEARGRQRGTQEAEQAVAGRQAELQRVLVEEVRGAQATFDELASTLETGGASPPGERALVFGPRELDDDSGGTPTVRIDAEQLDRVRERLDRLEGFARAWAIG